MKYYHKPLVTGGTAVCPINFPSPSLFLIPNQKEVIKSRKQLIYKPNPEVCFSPHEITPLRFRKSYRITGRERKPGTFYLAPEFCSLIQHPKKGDSTQSFVLFHTPPKHKVPKHDDTWAICSCFRFTLAEVLSQWQTKATHCTTEYSNTREFACRSDTVPHFNPPPMGPRLQAQRARPGLQQWNKKKAGFYTWVGARCCSGCSSSDTLASSQQNSSGQQQGELSCNFRPASAWCWKLFTAR